MNKKYKILVLSHAFLKKINLSFYEQLGKNKNYKISCVVPTSLINNGKKIYPDFNHYNGLIKVIKCKLKNSSTSRLFYFLNIKKYIISEKPNLIILDNDTVSLQSLILIFYSFFFKYKISYFCNENNLKNIIKKFSLKKFFKLILIFIINLFIKFKVNNIFCYTRQIQENYDFLGYKNKTFIIPLGYDEKIFFLPKKKKNKKKIIISYFGRIIPEKGIHILIKSLENLKNLHWEFMLDIDQVENNLYYENIIKNLKKNFQKGRIKFIKCNHYQIAKYMKKSHIVVLPSLYEEQYGRVIQEAVACGNVVVGSNIGSIPEIIKDKDLLFSPGDFNKLSNILKKLFKRNFFNRKFKQLHKRIINERTISKQVLLFNKCIKI